MIKKTIDIEILPLDDYPSSCYAS